MAEQNDPNSVTIMVPSKDPEQKEDLTPKHSKGKEPEDKDVTEIVGAVCDDADGSRRRTCSSRPSSRCLLSASR